MTALTSAHVTAWRGRGAAGQANGQHAPTPHGDTTSAIATHGCLRLPDAGSVLSVDERPV